MNKIVLERVIPIMDKHFKVCEDLEEFKTRVIDFGREYGAYYEALKKWGAGLKLDEDENEMTDEELDLVEEYSKQAEIYIDFNKNYTASLQKFETITKELEGAVKEFERLRDRINLQSLEKAHAMKLVDNFEKSAIEKQTNYFEYKKEFEKMEMLLAETKQELKNWL